MVEQATIARPYAEALFSVAKAGNVAAWSDLLSEMAYVATYPDILAFASNPLVTSQQVVETFLATLKSPMTAEAKNFVQTLVENHRLASLPEIAAQFHALKNAAEGSADADIVSAYPLTDVQLKELLVVLEKRFGTKLNPTVTVDSDLIGGVCVTVGDEVFDTSVRAKLKELQAALAA